jgi:hypothetical protein
LCLHATAVPNALPCLGSLLPARGGVGRACVGTSGGPGAAGRAGGGAESG